MKNLHDIIQKNMAEFEKNWCFDMPSKKDRSVGRFHLISNKGKEITQVGSYWAAEHFKTFLLSSQLSIIQSIDEMIDEVIKKKEQVHGFQTYHTCDEECEVNCKRLRDERKIFFDGWDDGRDLMKIDLMKIHSFLEEAKTKLQ